MSTISMQLKKERTRSVTLIFMCWLLYVCSYLGRYSYNSNVLPISLFYGKTNTEVGWATTMFFFAYGAGQIVNGLFCRYYNVKYVLSGALVISAALNMSVFFGIPFVYIKYVWLLNGMAQSVLWSSLLMTLSKNLDGKYMRAAIIAMSTTASTGTLLAYGLSALFALWNGFKYSFLVGAVTIAASAVAWFILCDKLKMTKAEKEEVVETTQKPAPETEKKKGMDGVVIYTLVFFGFLAIIVNLIKDGLSTWVPKILYDSYGLSESLSIVITLVLPVLTVFGTTFVIALGKKIKDHSHLVTVVFALATAFLGLIVYLLTTSYWAIVIVAFGLLSLLMSGANNIITSIVPLELRSRANSGFLGGILNGCCYVGSTLSSVLLGALSDKFGWDIVFYIILALGGVAVLVGIVNAIVKRALKK